MCNALRTGAGRSGSGNLTVIKMRMNGQIYIGIEIEERFYGMARKRIESELQQKRLDL